MAKPEELSPEKGHLITVGAFVLPLIVLLIVGLVVGNLYTSLAFAIAWTGLFVASSVRFVRKKTCLVVERFGYLWDVKFAGPRLMIPWIDTVVSPDDIDFLQKSVKLFAGKQIDFRGGTAAVDTSAWYQIGDPGAISAGDMDALREQVVKYVYTIRDAEKSARIAEIFEGSFRPYLEIRTIEEVQAEAEDIAKKAVFGEVDASGVVVREGAIVALEEIGVYPFPGKCIILSDIILSPEIVGFRQQQAKGEADAKQQVAQARALWQPLTEMKKGLAQAGPGAMQMSDEALAQFYLAQKGFETLQNTGANVTLVASGVDSARALITVGANQPPTQGGNP
jgi:regulator of protease activity HflC (stomatin/prohibitin superfamily)